MKLYHPNTSLSFDVEGGHVEGHGATQCRSHDDCYRYLLQRVLNRLNRYKPMFVIGLNPSTASHQTNDPTIRRCIGFANREHCTHLFMLNLFAYRATFPEHLKAAIDPIGPLNDHFLLDIHDHKNPVVVAAWGNVGTHQNRAARVMTLLQGLEVFCFGTTQHGHPKHPLYLRKDQPLELFKGY